MLRFGNISEININTGFARVKFLDEPDIVSDWLQICVQGTLSSKFFSMFDINEQVACLMDEHSEEGVILGALYNTGTPPPAGVTADAVTVVFSDETSIKYDRASHKLTVNVAGQIDITADSLNITGDIELAGKLTATGEVQSGLIKLSTHAHSGVQTGGGTSGPPIP